MTRVRPSNFDIGGKGLPPSQPVSSLSVRDLRGVGATLGDGCGIWEHLQCFREVKHLQGCSGALWMAICIMARFGGGWGCGGGCGHWWPIWVTPVRLPWVGDSPSLLFHICFHLRWGHGLSGHGWGLWHFAVRFLWADARLLVARVGLVCLRGR